ncbi:hypothetical protein D3C84_1123070 [compost metagenome]
MLQERLAGLGQRDPAGTAIQQSCLQTLFKPYDLSTDVGRRNPQAFGGGGELAAFGHGDEFVNALPAVIGHE